MWIKICGLTSAAAVAAALDAGVDALGFVLAPSPRRVTAQAAAALALPARGRVPCFAVMRHPTQAEVDEALAVFAPDAIQSDWQDFEALTLPAGLARLPVLRDSEPWPNDLPARALFEGSGSGTGASADWRLAVALAEYIDVVLAGGLTAANVGAAIAAVRPFGVDVSSGVEERPGLKSPAAIAAFVAAARALAVVRGPA
jgi:phosphoribosylanthranilate isomerase